MVMKYGLYHEKVKSVLFIPCTKKSSLLVNNGKICDH